MADTVAVRTIFSGSRRAVFAFTNVSDGTGEAAVQKIDISALKGSPSKVSILKAQFCTVGMSVSILFDHDTDDLAMILDGHGEICMKQYGGLPDPASAGGTGDILFTTTGAGAGDTYFIVLEIGW